MAQVLAVVRGGAVAVFVGVLLFALDIVVGFAGAVSTLVFLVGAVAGMVIGVTRRGPIGLTISGSVLVGVTAIGAGIATGFGSLEYAMALASVLAVVWVGRGEPSLEGLGREWIWPWLQWCWWAWSCSR